MVNGESFGVVAPALRVLIVEDNADTAWMTERLLGKLAELQVECVMDGPSALEKLSEFRPHMVLLDIGLPRMDGFKVARKIRDQSEFDEVLLVALTGYGRAEDRRRSAEAGFDVHLLKPAGVDELKRLLVHPKLTIQSQL